MAEQRCREHKLRVVRDARCVLCLTRRKRWARACTFLLVAGLAVALRVSVEEPAPLRTASSDAALIRAAPARAPTPAHVQDDAALSGAGPHARGAHTDVTTPVEVAQANAEDRYLDGVQARGAPMAASGTRAPEPPRATIDPTPWAADDPRDWDVPQRSPALRPD